MSIHPLAGKPAPPHLLIDTTRLLEAYEHSTPDAGNPAEQVTFGTSGHRGAPEDSTFTQAHVLAITQAICEYRAGNGIRGPLFVGKDTHAVSDAAQQTALEVLAGNGVETIIQENNGPTPTPVISHAILTCNAGRTSGLADGIVITPSHNPPSDGGFKYNPPHGGPADTGITSWIEQRANQLLKEQNRSVRRRSSPSATEQDLIAPYIRDLANIIDLEAIRAARVRIGVDPMGGAALHYWAPLGDLYGLEITVVNPRLDPGFAFMRVDHDGKIRMDCSSPYAMAGLTDLKDQFDIAFGNDPDADRHGIVTRSAGLLNPNHYLAVAIDYLLSHRPEWSRSSGVGKTLVSSGMIDRVVAARGRRLVELPVGFKWFVPGLLDGSICFGGEESAGASFLRKNGSVWTTDKDGLILGLLAAEITAITGKDPGEYYRSLAGRFGECYYARVDAPATREQKNRLNKLSPDSLPQSTLAGDPILARLTQAPGNGAAIGGIKVVTTNGWFAARPSGTENICKLYAESFLSESHLRSVVEQAQAMIT